MQKFTRPLTREIELEGQRLALTFSDTGLSFRPVGSRKPPREVTWAELIALVTKTDAPPEPAAEPKSAPTAETVTALLLRLEDWLTKHRKRFLESMPSGASAADLQALETALGRPVPADLRALLSWHDGQSDDFVGSFCERWFLLSARQIADAHAKMLREAGDRWKPEWVPFFNDDRDNAVFLDTAYKPAPVREFWQHNPEQSTTAPSLADWLKDFVTAVEAGQFTQDPERGHFVRST